MKRKYEKPMLLKLDGFDISTGNCKPGQADQGSCKTGGQASPGMCGLGIGANANCNTGNGVV